MSAQEVMAKLHQTSAVLVEVDPILKFMKTWGIPLTREAYLEVLGLTEPLDAALEGKIPNELI